MKQHSFQLMVDGKEPGNGNQCIALDFSDI